MREQSGHILSLDGHVSGDGLLGAFSSRGPSSTGTTLAELASVLEPFPQARRNVSVRRERGDTLRSGEEIEASTAA